MVEPSQLTQHIELYVDTANFQQAASLDAIVSFLKNDVMTIESLVRDMGMYLTTTDHIIRARGILLLGEALTQLSSKPLDNATIHSLIEFFAGRLADWRALRGALVGCLALVQRNSGGTVTSTDAKAVASSYLQNLQVQSLAQYDRKLCFELLECLLERYPNPVASLGDVLVYGVCEAVDGEKDPQCLMMTFHIVEIVARMFPDPNGPVAKEAADLFGFLGCYFPIHFTHPKAEDIDVKRDDLSIALMLAFSATPLFEPFAVPLLLEKLSSSLPSAKVDSLKYLSYCMSKYGADRMAKHAIALWSSIKDILCASGGEAVLPFTSKSLYGPYFVENEMTKEALVLLENVIVQNSDLYLRLIIGDEEVNTIFNIITSYKSYIEIPLPEKQKLHVVGYVLYVSTKASVLSCNRVFETFFSRLMDILGSSFEHIPWNAYSREDCVINEKPNYGCLYLCVGLLVACRDLLVSSEGLTSPFSSSSEVWCFSLQQFSMALTKAFMSALATAASEDANRADMLLGVGGLQIILAFPGGYSFISKSTLDNVLMTLVLIITKDFNKALLWKLALRALVQIGLVFHESNEMDKANAYMEIVVEKIVSLLSADFHDIPLSLKLEAISTVGTIGPRYTMKVVQAFQDIIHAKFYELYVHGHIKSSNVTLQLLNCYSDTLLPWIQKTEGFEDVLLQFVVNLWNDIENCKALTFLVHEEEVLDAMVKMMKLTVACCSVGSQSIIVDKAYKVLLSSTNFVSDSSIAIPVWQEGSEIGQEKNNMSRRNEWVHCLFASVIIALHQEIQIPDRRILFYFMTALLEGSLAAAHALGSIINKLGQKSDATDVTSDCTFDQEMDLIFKKKLCNLDNDPLETFDGTKNGMDLISICLGAAKSESLQANAIVGITWIGKGLLLRGHERIKDVTKVLLKCLLSNYGSDTLPSNNDSLENHSEDDVPPYVKKCAADAFEVLLSDSEFCLNRTFHAVIRPLYKQRFFTAIFPILMSLVSKSDPSSTRPLLLRVLAHVIIHSPLILVLNEAEKLIPILVDGLTSSSKDASDKDITYGLLLVLSGILTDKAGQEAVLENVNAIICCLTGLVSYPHMMLVRETAIQCLVAMSGLPHSRIYPFRTQVLQAISKALDDPKRAVRQEAVRCRQTWASIASRSLHF